MIADVSPSMHADTPPGHVCRCTSANARCGAELPAHKVCTSFHRSPDGHVLRRTLLTIPCALRRDPCAARSMHDMMQPLVSGPNAHARQSTAGALAFIH